MSSHTSLDAAAQERKARLAKLKSLKRKMPEHGEDEKATMPASEESTSTNRYLSGRNYDIAARGPKLGFENDPSQDQDTAERRAKDLADQARAEAAAEQQSDAPLDLFKLQPKKPNWDLKRDMDSKMAVLKVRTENAMARFVRERIAAQKQSGKNQAGGVVGGKLVSTALAQEQQEQENEQHEREGTEFEGFE